MRSIAIAFHTVANCFQQQQQQQQQQLRSATSLNGFFNALH